jgi:hypothetical protein
MLVPIGAPPIVHELLRLYILSSVSLREKTLAGISLLQKILIFHWSKILLANGIVPDVRNECNSGSQISAQRPCL